MNTMFFESNARDGRAYIARSSLAAAVAGQFPGFALTAATGKQLFVNRIRLYAEGAAATTFVHATIGIITAALSGWTDQGTCPSTKSDAADSSSKVFTISAASAPTLAKTLYIEGLRFINDPAINTRFLDLDLRAPIIVSPGNSLVILSDNTATATAHRFNCEFVEKG